MPINQGFALRLSGCWVAAVLAGPAPAFAFTPRPAPPDEASTFDDQLRAEEGAIEARQRKIEAELAQLAKQPPGPGPDAWAAEWAGRYYAGDGLGMNAVIMIAPRSGVAYTWHGCVGLYDGNHGDIAEVLPDGLRLTLVLDEKGSSYHYMASRLYFIRSGAARFIIPACQMMDYVNRRNGCDGLIISDPPCRVEGRRAVHGAEPGDDFALPAEFEALLIRRPITLTVVRSSDLQTGVSPLNDLVVRCRVELRSDPPVYPGLEFVARSGLERGWITIDRVDGTSCSGSLFGWGPAGSTPKPPQPGVQYHLSGATPVGAATPPSPAVEPR